MKSVSMDKAKIQRVITIAGFVFGSVAIVCIVKFGIEMFLFVKDVMEMLNALFH